MKITRKPLLALMGLLLIFTLLGCSANNDSDLDNDDKKIEIPENQEVEVDNLDESEHEDFVEEGQPKEPKGADIAIDPQVEMINSSDYISKIKVIKKDSNSTEIKILENIKGNLSHEDLPTIDNLEINKVYLIFLKDVDNNLILTDENKGLIPLDQNNNEIFKKINREIHDN